MNKLDDAQPSLSLASFSQVTLSKEGVYQDKLTIGGIITFSLIMVQAFISLQPLDPPSVISIAGFAMGVPLLAVYITLCDRLQVDKPIPAPTDIILIYAIGTLSAAIGMIAAFWHVSWILGTLFLVSSCVGMSVISRHVAGNGALKGHIRRPVSEQEE